MRCDRLNGVLEDKDECGYGYWRVGISSQRETKLLNHLNHVFYSISSCNPNNPELSWDWSWSWSWNMGLAELFMISIRCIIFWNINQPRATCFRVVCFFFAETETGPVPGIQFLLQQLGHA